jgi:hypothetical protein
MDHSRKHRFQQYLYCCMHIHCHGNVFTKLLPRNGSTRYTALSLRLAYRHTAISFLRAVLATSVLGLTFLPMAHFS